MTFSKSARDTLEAPATREALLNFNQQHQVYVKVPYEQFMRHKDQLINHALRKPANLEGWHAIVKNPHAFAHITQGDKVVLEVPPILARIPTVNPKSHRHTLSVAAQEHERIIDKTPVAAERLMQRAVDSYPVPEYRDKYIQDLWINLLEVFEVIKPQPKQQTASQRDTLDEDLFDFD